MGTDERTTFYPCPSVKSVVKVRYCPPPCPSDKIMAGGQLMEQVRAKNPVVLALYVNAALLLLILLMLCRRADAPGLTPATASAQQIPPRVGGGPTGVFVMPAQFNSELWGCYLLDVDAQTLCSYEYDPGTRELKLISARDFRYDCQLKNFATIPAPWEVQQMVEQERPDEHGNQTKPPANPPSAQP
jgi:hypothetical protein